MPSTVVVARSSKARPRRAFEAAASHSWYVADGPLALSLLVVGDMRTKLLQYGLESKFGPCRVAFWSAT